MESTSEHLPTIIFKAIKHSSQRYPTVGDYFRSHGIQNFRVSRMNADFEFLVLLHEFIEWYLTQRRGITEKEITAFDVQFENEREQGIHGDDEPGDSPDAPYRKEHEFATFVERMLADEIGIDWNEYEQTIINL